MGTPLIGFFPWRVEVMYFVKHPVHRGTSNYKQIVEKEWWYLETAQ